MPKYSIKAPNGQTYQIDGPDGASDEQVRAEVMRQHPDAGGSAPAREPKSVTGFLGNAGMDAANILKSGMQQFGPEGLPAQAVMHPVKTFDAAKDFASNAADILKGGMQHVREMSPPEQQGSAPKADTRAYDKFAGENYDKYGTKENLGNTVYKHPAGTALTIASILDPALAAAGVERGIVGAASKGAAAVKSASAPAVSAIKEEVAARLPAPRVPPPTVPELKADAGKLYDKAKEAGVVIKGPAYKTFADKLKIAMDGEGIDKDLHPKASAALKRIVEDANGQPVTLNKLEVLRKIASDATGVVDKADKRIARLILDGINDYQLNLRPKHILAGNAPKAVKLLNEARTTWQNAARGETIDKMIEKAHFNAGAFKSNLDSSLRTEFKKLANNERGISRFSPAQKVAIRKVAFGDGPVQSVMHIVGRVIPSSNMGVLTTSGVAGAAGILGAHLASPVGAGIAGAGLVGKVGSTMITSKNAIRASEIARGGSKITPRSDAYYRIQKRRDARKAAKGQ